MEQKQTKRKKHLALWIVLGVLAVAAIVGAWYVHRLLNRPESFFTETSAVATALPEATALVPVFPISTATAAPEPVEPDATATPEPTASPEPTEEPLHRLNILLMGIDAYADGGTSSGTMPHADVAMVIAINFDTQTVDLITLPRDTFTTVPGYRGYYKLNGVFNVGGGMDDPEAGFELMCRTAEQWLGGIQIPYYYGLDFEAVVDIVDAIGGIDYDVDQPFTSHDGKRHYNKGMHHLDGSAVLGYLRIRRAADGLDSSRTARQRRMMVAIFQKLKNENLFMQLPALINAAYSGIHTNTTLAQTTTLASYAAQLPTENIRTRAMYGSIRRAYEWGFCFVDQQNRIDLIREVFGLEVGPVGTCTPEYEAWLHRAGFYALKAIQTAEKVLQFVADQKAAGTTFTEEQIELYSACYLQYTALRDGFAAATDALTALYTAADSDEITRKAAETEWQMQLKEQRAALKEATAALAASVGYKQVLRWNVATEWYEDPDINEVYVDFR